jgi:hypothetical protein
MPAKRSHLSVHPAGQVGRAGSSLTTCPTSAAACPHTQRSYCENNKTNFVSTQLAADPDSRSLPPTVSLRAVGSLTPIRSGVTRSPYTDSDKSQIAENGAPNLRGVYVSWRESVDSYCLGSQLACHAPSHL